MEHNLVAQSPLGVSKPKWIEIATLTAQALITYELETNQTKSHFTIDYAETRFVHELWGSKRSGGEWGTRISIALDVGNLDDEVSIVPTKILVLADDFQPWGDGNEIPVILAVFDRNNIVGAAQESQRALISDLSERFDQLVENEDTGRYEIQRG
jgi:hypothetical protein